MTWQETTLDQLAFFQRGFDITKKEQIPGDVPVVSSSGINSYHNQARVTAPGVVIGRKGTLGKVHWVDVDFWPHDTSLWVKDFKGNDPRFVYYFIHTMHFERFDAGGANPTLNRNHIHKLKILKPPLKIQERIAGILSAYDDLIDNNNRRIALLEEAIHRLYREWFVHLRFPGHEQTPVVDGVPEGWEKRPLGNIAQEMTRRVHPSELNEPVPYVGLGHIPRQSIALVEWESSDDVTSSKFRFEKGEILFGKIRPYFHKVVFAPISGICSSDTIVIRPYDPTHQGLILAVASSESFVQFASKTSKEGSKMPRANWKVMAQYPVFVPSNSLLADFEGFVSNSTHQIETLLQMNRKLKEARDALLPRLMNGSLPV